MRSVAVAVVLFSSMLIIGCTASSPPHQMIEHAYFKCESSRTLHGGIFGKGPTKRFGPPSECTSGEWERISRDEFKRLAEEWHGYDWATEAAFWDPLSSAASRLGLGVELELTDVDQFEDFGTICFALVDSTGNKRWFYLDGRAMIAPDGARAPFTPYRLYTDVRVKDRFVRHSEATGIVVDSPIATAVTTVLEHLSESTPPDAVFDRDGACVPKGNDPRWLFDVLQATLEMGDGTDARHLKPRSAE